MTCFIVADFDMYHLVFGINFQIHFASLVCHLSIHLLIHLSTHLCHHRHCQHPSLLHFFNRGSKRTFSTNPFPVADSVTHCCIPSQISSCIFMYKFL